MNSGLPFCRRFFLLIACFAALQGAQAARVKPRKTAAEVQALQANNELKENVSKLEIKLALLDESVNKLGNEMDALRARSRAVMEATNINYLNATYLKAGLSLLVPRPATFAFSTNPGLGAYVGVGQYLGRNNVLDISFDWDVYPALSFRYRYEFHETIPLFNWGPVLGYKVKAANLPSFDSFLGDPSSVNTSFFFFGGMLSIPMNQSLMTMELLYWVNGQTFIVANMGIHFFL
jgi:hypothetical protein